MKWLKKVGLIVLLFYFLICLIVYGFQEKLMFFPEKLAPGYSFPFKQKFEEIAIPVGKTLKLNGVLFHADKSKGLVFYLHGKAGSIRTWGKIAPTYLNLHYDLFLLDYRGYGKSEGSILDELTLYRDIQIAYDTLLNHYHENTVTIIGYSLGTGLAAYLASNNRPRQLILQAPYYSFKEIAAEHHPLLPSALLRYEFPTWEYLENTRVPVTVFHGDVDQVISSRNSVSLLRPFYKPGDQLVVLKGQGHSGITDNPDYRAAISKLLN